MRTTFDHLWRYLSCHLVIWAKSFVAFLFGTILWKILLNRLHLLKDNKIIKSMKAELDSILVACKTHNLEVPSSNPVGDQNYCLNLFFAVILNVNVIFSPFIYNFDKFFMILDEALLMVATVTHISTFLPRFVRKVTTVHYQNLEITSSAYATRHLKTSILSKPTYSLQ